MRLPSGTFGFFAAFAEVCGFAPSFTMLTCGPSPVADGRANFEPAIPGAVTNAPRPRSAFPAAPGLTDARSGRGTGVPFAGRTAAPTDGRAAVTVGVAAGNGQAFASRLTGPCAAFGGAGGCILTPGSTRVLTGVPGDLRLENATIDGPDGIGGKSSVRDG